MSPLPAALERLRRYRATLEVGEVINAGVGLTADDLSIVIEALEAAESTIPKINTASMSEFVGRGYQNE
ncbi:hypothetical protein [Sphingomonas aerophila]|jgi:hypothetical protein|uniref:Uncharacterized protein n=1 Tax=Sphingomonas aerophila TaxID=1344948 RepID=A0A7W9EXR2_9SPHN|nr:hypothetical protein [Sphingomonas aerophila]MBB5717052.1 hypothetical protein [Sphingomonas aerophila]